MRSSVSFNRNLPFAIGKNIVAVIRYTGEQNLLVSDSQPAGLPHCETSPQNLVCSPAQRKDVYLCEPHKTRSLDTDA